LDKKYFLQEKRESSRQTKRKEPGGVKSKEARAKKGAGQFQESQDEFLEPCMKHSADAGKGTPPRLTAAGRKIALKKGTVARKQRKDGGEKGGACVFKGVGEKN